MKGLISDKPKRTLTGTDMVRMGVGKRFWNCTLAGMTTASQKPKIEGWVKNLKSNLSNGHGLLLMGDYSRGKTGSGVICMKATAMHGGTAFMIRANAVERAIFDKSMFDSDESIYDRMLSVDLLLFDDLGSGHKSQWGLSVIEEVLRDRSDRRAATVVTTNLAKEAMKETFGDSMMNFLSGALVAVICDGQDFRDDEREEIRRSVE